jgi:branched-chain amino acid transport system ATP-binding protein
VSAPATPVAALVVRDLKAGYGRKTVVHGVSLRVAAGGTTVLLGANGAGKSTTLKAIVGGVDVTGGVVEHRGTTVRRGDPAQNLRNGVALVPEGGRVFRDFTVEKNLRLGSFARRRSAVTAERRELVLETFPRLRERLHQRAGTLSGGERQMLAISRTLLAEPDVLLLDEPFLGLAPITIDRLIASITDLQQRLGLSLLIVEQNPKALEMADSIAVMRLGEIVLEEDDPSVFASDDGMRRLERSMV